MGKITRKKEENVTRIKLCGVQGCCPTIEIHRDKVTITDDYGGKVNLTKKQWQDALNKAK